jgi:lysyl-tRNA synthetase class 1
MKIPEWLEQAVTAFDQETKPHNELTIMEALDRARKSQGNLSDEDLKRFLADRTAFYFIEYRTRQCPWNTYFGPMGSGTPADGEQVFWPDIKEIDAEIIAHWQDRAKAVRDSVMRARYADLVWDLKKLVTGDKPSAEYARIACDAYLESVREGRYTMPIEGVHWIQRSLDLSLSINDHARTEKIVQFMFEFHDRISDPPQTGHWIFLFDSLYDRKGLLSAEQEQRIIQNLETKLAEISDANSSKYFDPYGAEAAMQRLARHYRRQKSQAEVERVTRTYGKAFEQLADKAAPIFAVSVLGSVVQAYQQEGLRDEAERVQIILANKGKDMAADLKEVSVSVELKEEEINAFIEQLTAGGLKNAVLQVAGYFVPKVEEAKKQLEYIRQNAPLMSMIPMVKIGDGRATAMIGALDDDPDGRLHNQLGQTMNFHQPFLVRALARFRERYAPSEDDILDCLFDSPMFANSRRELLREGLIAYNQEDFLKAVHVLVPQVEYILRSFLSLIGIPALKTVPRHPGIMDAKNMNDVLDDTRIRQILSENLWRYLAILYVDRKGGLNLRNDLAHGLLGPEMFNRNVADRVFHSLLALSVIRATPAQAATAGPAE